MIFNLLYGNDDETLTIIIIFTNERKHLTGGDIEIIQIHNEKHMLEAAKQMLTIFF